MARKRRAEQPLVRRPALADPKNPSKPQAVAVENNTKTALRNIPVSRTTRRRWNRKPRVTTSDVAAWTFCVLLTAAGLMSLCVLLALVWSKP